MRFLGLSTIWLLAGLLAFGLLAPGHALAVDPVNKNLFGVAVKGYDVVAYFTQGAALEGDSDHTYEWKGAIWRFANRDNRDRFAKDPTRYAPQYAGYCAYAVSRGSTAAIDPEAWKIVDGKLYLNLSKDIQAIWEEDIPGNIERADRNWPKILGRK